MLRHSLFRIFVVLLLSTSSCEQPPGLVFKAPDPELVVVSNFTNQEVMQVQVSRSKDVQIEDDNLYIRDAIVELFEGDEFIERLILVDSPTPFYQTYELKPRSDVQYTIRVEAPGFKTVTAKSSIPTQINLDEIEISDLHQLDIGTNQRQYDYDLTLAFRDPGLQKNFYHLKFVQRVKEFIGAQEEIKITNIRNHEITFSTTNDNNSKLAYFDGGILFEDGMLDGQRITFSFQLQTIINTDREILGKFITELRTVSEEYYDFHRSLGRQQSSTGPPFTDPVIIDDNIENGQGVFAGYASSKDSLSIF